MTVHDQSAVRRVLRDYKRAQELWVKIKARPSHLAAGFQEVAETNEDHEIEIFFPVPQMSDALYAQLVGDRELGEEAKGNLLEVRRCAEAFEAIEDMEAWFWGGHPCPCRADSRRVHLWGFNEIGKPESVQGCWHGRAAHPGC